MTITCDAIQANGHILPQYTCDGTNVSPPLTFSEIPSGTKSLTLILEDPDSPKGTFTHWLLYDMSPATLQLMENTMPMTGKSGTNDAGTIGYFGPCPNRGTHRYIFRLYALDKTLKLPQGATKEELQQAMEGHVINSCKIEGNYTKLPPAAGS